MAVAVPLSKGTWIGWVGNQEIILYYFLIGRHTILATENNVGGMLSYISNQSNLDFPYKLDYRSRFVCSHAVRKVDYMKLDLLILPQLLTAG